MTFKFSSLLLSFCVTFAVSAQQKKLHIVTTLPELAFVAQEIGGANVEVESLLNGSENPHFLDVKPSFIRRVANSDILCVVGLELEVAWIPKVIAKSGNRQVHEGEKGYCDFGSILAHKGLILEKPERVDRSMGDVHAHGNPHFWLDPKLLALGGDALLQALKRVDPLQSAFYEKRYQDFSAKMTALHQELLEKLQKASEKKRPILFIDYHKDFSYFAHSYHLVSFGSIEEKPGVAPGAGRIAQIALEAKRGNVQFALASLHSPKKILEKFSQSSGVPVFNVPTQILKNDEKFNTYELVQRNIVQHILSAL